MAKPLTYRAIALVIVLSAAWLPAQAADRVQVNLAWAVEGGGQSGVYSGALELEDGEFDGYLDGTGSAQLSGKIEGEQIEIYGALKPDPNWKLRRFKVTITLRDGTASSKFQTGGGILRAGGAGGEFDIELTLKVD